MHLVDRVGDVRFAFFFLCRYGTFSRVWTAWLTWSPLLWIGVEVPTRFRLVDTRYASSTPKAIAFRLPTSMIRGGDSC